MARGLRPERDGHSSGTPVAGRLMQPTRTTGPGAGLKRLWRFPSFLFGLAPGGACRAADVTARAVRSCRTLSPLPPAKLPKGFCGRGGLLSVALSLGSPPPDVIRRRFSVEPGLSSAPATSAGCGGRPADWRARLRRRAGRGQPWPARRVDCARQTPARRPARRRQSSPRRCARPAAAPKCPA